MSNRPTILYAFHMTGCSVCEEEMPKVREWATARVAQAAFVPINVSFVPWRPEGCRDIKATPTFIVLRGPDELAFHEGAFRDEAEFEKFLKGALR